jgi:glycosyltransferase involved in cell wall biosynthesis
LLSIIVAVHNQLAMNRLFWRHLLANTTGDWELIIVDNGSSDGSADFFEAQGATVLRNGGNYSYPYCQNRGIQVAKGEWLAFLNNDVIVPAHWNTRLQTSMQHHGMDVMTSCGIEHVETVAATKRLRRRWRWIKNLVLLVGGRSENSLALMHRLMYPRWQHFTEQRARDHGLQRKPGFVGNTVMMTRRALDLIGVWDERIQAADFDLYMRVQQRHTEHGDIQPVHIALDVFVHHYIRLTEGVSYPPFVDRERLIRLEDKWSEAQRLALAPPV